MLRAALLALALLSLPGAAAPSGRRLAVVDLATPPTMVGLGFQLTQAVADAARAQGYVVFQPGEVRKSLGEDKYKELMNCGAVPACASAKLAGFFTADRAVLGTLRRDEKNYLVQLWLLDLQKGSVVSEVDRAILIASRRLVQDVTDAIPPLLRGESEKRGTLTITSPVRGAEVVLNGEELGATPVTTQLKPGRYEIQVTKKNYMSVQRLVDVNAGQTTVEEVRLILLPGMKAEPEAFAAAGGGKGAGEPTLNLPWTAWLAFGTAAAAASAGGYFGLQARVIQGRLELGRDPASGIYGGTRAEALAGRSDALAANVLYATAIAAAAGGVLLTVYAPPEAPPLKAGALLGPSGPLAAVQGHF